MGFDFEFDGAMRMPLKYMMTLAVSLGILGGMADRACGGLLELQVSHEQRLEAIESSYATRIATLVDAYAEALTTLSEKVRQSGNLDKALAVSAEIEQFAASKHPSSAQSNLPELRALMDTYRAQSTKFSDQRSKAVLALGSIYDKELEQLEKQLVTDGDLEAAKAVRVEREVKRKGLQSLAESAPTKQDFTNSLGMRFVPMEVTGGLTEGKKILFSVWETRRRDYEAYANANVGANEEWKDAKYKGVPAGHEPDHPVVMVNWEDAQAFCRWLTITERDSKRIGGDDTYRLPTDHEWSCAVGIGMDEDVRRIPGEKSGIARACC